jgi:hypothetical protein
MNILNAILKTLSVMADIVSIFDGTFYKRQARKMGYKAVRKLTK